MPETITGKGPHGNYLTPRGPAPARLTQVRIGENIASADTEALAISLEKARKKSPEYTIV